MSKNSSVQRYTQLKEWLETRKKATSKKEGRPAFSKTDYYNKANNRYGN